MRNLRNGLYEKHTPTFTLCLKVSSSDNICKLKSLNSDIGPELDPICLTLKSFRKLRF